MRKGFGDALRWFGVAACGWVLAGCATREALPECRGPSVPINVAAALPAAVAGSGEVRHGG
jgi:hypothetical protein